MRKTKVLFLVLVLSLCLLPAVALAAFLDFTVGDGNLDNIVGGTISYNAATKILSATNLEIADAKKTPPGFVWLISSGVLNFNTGPLNLGASSPNFWVFTTPGSLITINGGVPLLGIANGTALMTGSNLTGTLATTAFGWEFAFGYFNDTKDSTFLNGVGMPVGSYTGTVTVALTAVNVGQNNDWQSTSIVMGDVKNTPVPIPPTVFLMLAGLMGIGVVRKRIK